MGYKCILLCAGIGSRLKPLTDRTPKPLLKVAGKPMIEHTIEHLKKLGFKDIIINTHYLAEKFMKWLENYDTTGINILLNHEKGLLGTAGSVKNAEFFLGTEEDFLVIYGDVICFEDFKLMMEYHKHKKMLGTMLVHEGISNSLVETGKTPIINNFEERPAIKKHGFVNSGIYIFNEKIFNYIGEGFQDFPRDIFPKIIPTKKFCAYPLSKYRIAVDSVQRLAKARYDLKNSTNMLK